MKFLKIILLLVFAVTIYSCEFNNNPASSVSAKVNRKVLVELSTNVNCVNCPPADHYLAAIDTGIAGITSSDTNVITLRMHSSIFANDPFYNFNVPVNSGRQSFYSVFLNPSGFLDGSLMPAFNTQTWTNSINLALAKNETQEVTYSNTFNAETKTGTLTLSVSQISGTAPSDLKLHVAIAESKLYYAGGSNGEVWFNNVLRDLLTGTTGQDISLPFNSNINYTLKDGITPENADIIIFTQSSSTKEVFAVRKLKLL